MLDHVLGGEERDVAVVARVLDGFGGVEVGRLRQSLRGVLSLVRDRVVHRVALGLLFEGVGVGVVELVLGGVLEVAILV